MKKRTILLSILAASTAAFIACAAPGESDTDESAGANTDEVKPREFKDPYEQHVSCLHYRRERVRMGGKEVKRAFHIKNHGCLHGTLTVDPGLPAQYREGIFKQAQWDNVVMRITNINQPADNVLDLRGLAIKVVGAVPAYDSKSGAKSLTADDDRLHGQDFLMNDTPVHFLNDPKLVVRANELTAPESAKPGKAEDLIIKQAVDERVLKALGTPLSQLNQPKSLLASEYHSRAPFQLGSKFTIRYYVEPCDKTRFDKFDPAKTLDYLTDDYKKRASEEGVCFLLKARIRSNANAGALDDLITPWTKNDAVEQTLAKVEFNKQTVDETNACDDLWFSPLNTLVEHQGVGAMNAGREFIYRASRAVSKVREKLGTDPSKRKAEIDSLRCSEIYPDDFETKLRDLRKDPLPTSPPPPAASAPSPAPSAP
jgi:hypothetical protein